jgi:hypothetical protein
MNARIRELADRVGLGVRHDGIILTKHVNAAEAFEQFAQLIIKANIDACETIADQASIIESGEMARKTSATAKSCANLIKLQFGVE